MGLCWKVGPQGSTVLMVTSAPVKSAPLAAAREGAGGLVAGRLTPAQRRVGFDGFVRVVHHRQRIVRYIDEPDSPPGGVPVIGHHYRYGRAVVEDVFRRAESGHIVGALYPGGGGGYHRPYIIPPHALDSGFLQGFLRHPGS